MQNKIGNILLVPISELKPNPQNPNTHSQEQISRLAQIIKHQGWRAPIVVSNQSKLVVTGHGRLEASKILGLEKVPVSYQDFATPADEKAHLLADNRLGELSEFDNAKLKDLIEELDTGEINLDFTGYSKQDLENLMSQFYQGESQDNIEEVDFPNLAQGDKQPFQQKTFVLHDEQAQEIDLALQNAQDLPFAQSSLNENKNGNLIYAICKKFNLEVASN
jgi:ParB-like chromosome segregation protein Spo0J